MLEIIIIAISLTTIIAGAIYTFRHLMNQEKELNG